MNLTALLQGVGGPWVYAVIAAAAFLESAAFVGLVVPGETVMLLGGVLAAAGQADLLGVVLVAVLGAVGGDQVGYTLGKALGPALRGGRLGRWIGHDRWASAEALVARRGGPAVFLGRWIGFLRAVVPAAAGAVGVPRVTFLAWNAVGGALWATTVVCGGFLAGASWRSVQAWLGTGALIIGVSAGAVVLSVVALRRRRFRDRSAPRASFSPEPLDPRTDIDDPAVVGSRGGGGFARWARTAAGVGAGLVLAVAAGELSDAVLDHPGPIAPEVAVLSWMLAHRTANLTIAAQSMSTVAGDVAMAVLAVIVAAGLAWRRRWRDAVLVAVVTVGVGVIVEGCKLVLARPRPPLALQLTAETNASFPSGHTTAVTAVLGVVSALLVARLRRRVARVAVGLGAAVVAILVGLSRLYLGAHWAGDVIGGWLLGGLWLLACLTCAAAWDSRLPSRSASEPYWGPPSGQVPTGSSTALSGRGPRG